MSHLKANPLVKVIANSRLKHHTGSSPLMEGVVWLLSDDAFGPASVEMPEWARGVSGRLLIDL